jgi:four helix bundle protein
MSYKVTKVTDAARSPSAAEKFQTFEDLEVYKTAREFRKAMYAVGRRLPDFEKYELGRQIRRAAVSLTNNMAEGHARFHYPDQIRFFLHSRGSLEELVDDLNVCMDENYLPGDEAAKLKEQSLGVLNLINGYLRYLRGRSLRVRESGEAVSAFIDELDDRLPLQHL